MFNKGVPGDESVAWDYTVKKYSTSIIVCQMMLSQRREARQIFNQSLNNAYVRKFGAES
jgi:hypothetical protein